MYELLLELCEKRGISITNLCLEITGSRGNLNTWKKGNINPVSLTKIADYFNVSTDYLLGRTDNPNGSYVNGDNSFQNVVGNNSSVTITDKAGKDNLTDEFIQLFDKLNFSDKVRIINIVNEIINK